MVLKRGNWLMAALVAEAKKEEAEAEQAEYVLDIAALTVKEIEEKVESGELTAAEVYEAELAGKQRKSILKEYAPADDNEQGTGVEAE